MQKGNSIIHLLVAHFKYTPHRLGILYIGQLTVENLYRPFCKGVYLAD